MRVLSGTQPTGANLHVGNYLGALRQYVDFQDKAEEALYFIADYHSMTTVRDAELRHAQSQAVALDYLAAGLDPERALLFRQSDVPQVCELTWILSTVTPMGLLERSHAYKDRIANGQSADHGLFAYPVLMASDVLIYHADIVPVGQDQKQHLEMARDMAQRFNHAYDTEALKLFEPYILEDSAVVPGTDGRKMSKSYGNTIRHRLDARRGPEGSGGRRLSAVAPVRGRGRAGRDGRAGEGGWPGLGGCEEGSAGAHPRLLRPHAGAPGRFREAARRRARHPAARCGRCSRPGRPGARGLPGGSRARHARLKDRQAPSPRGAGLRAMPALSRSGL
jgi:hypothetical protein